MRPALVPAVVLSLALGACARRDAALRTLPARARLDASEHPSLFLSPDPTAAQVGYVSEHALVTLRGEAKLGRVPVRIEGPLHVEGWVPADLLQLVVQHRGRVRGTPAYVAPNQRVRLLGADADRERLRVEVSVSSGLLGRFEGSFPRIGLDAGDAPADARPAAAASKYRVPANTTVPLFDLPPSVSSTSHQVAELPAQPAAYEVDVVRAIEGSLAVRAGDGPWLVGWTNVALEPLPVAVAPANEPRPSRQGAIPARLANERGELRAVAKGTKVRFGDQVVGVFERAGWARVQTVYPSGFADVFAAVDDDVAVRGVVPSSALSEIASPADAR